MFRRSRKPRSQGLWYPTKCDVGAVQTTVVTAAAAFGATVTNAALISDSLDTPDNPATPGYLAGTLATVTRPGHLIKRIVGSVFVNSNSVNECYAVFGIIVDRTDNTGALANLAAWSPFAENSVQKRWLFRRVWRLGTNGSPGGAVLTNNAEYGSMREGTQVDSKMKARLGYEERLFLIMGVQNGSAAAAVSVTFTPLLRMFAKPLS